MREMMSVSSRVALAALALAPVNAFCSITASLPEAGATNVTSGYHTEVIPSDSPAPFQLVQLAADDKKAAFPPVRIQVQVGTQQRRVGGDSYRKEMNVQPKIVIEGVTRAVSIPAAEAVMMIVTMDTRAKYVQRREVYRVEKTQTLPIPAANDGQRRQFEFDPAVVNFDSWRDQTNVGGYVYKYYVFALRDPQTKAIVDFQTNNPGLAAAAKTNPEKREEILGLQQNAEFPDKFK